MGTKESLDIVVWGGCGSDTGCYELDVSGDNGADNGADNPMYTACTLSV